MAQAHETLVTLQQHAQQLRDKALGKVTSAEQQWQAAVHQGEQLHAYLAEHQQRFGAASGQSTTIEQLRHLQQFTLKINDAMAQQQMVVEQHAGRVQRLRAQLQEAEQKLGAVNKLLERRRQQQSLEQLRREQKQTDEFASRKAWDRLHGGLGT